MLIESVLKTVESLVADKALKYCLTNKLYSAVDFKDAAIHYSRIVDTEELIVDAEPLRGITESASKALSVKAKVRDINEYAKIFNEN